MQFEGAKYNMSDRGLGMQEKKRTGLKMAGKVIGFLLLFILVCLIVYVAYVVLSYKRLEDNIVLEVHTVSAEGQADSAENPQKAAQVETPYTIVTYNIGFGAYVPSFSFFMDGGKSSVGESRESVTGAVNGAAAYVKGLEPDFMLWQEVDLNSTRSYHMNQYEMIQQYFDGYDTVFAVNYDSAFLFYPFTEPHGKSKAGIATLSRFGIEGALRRSFPIATSLNKFFDLDRCYSISRIPVENGKHLCIFNLHMSAYGNDDSIRAGQISMLCGDMQKEYEAGNYVVCGGDFNHDLKNLGGADESTKSWAYPFPRESLPEGFSFCLDGFSREERDSMWDSARNADMPYIEGETFTITLDGFIISGNVECLEYENLRLDYAYSDHDPVRMRFLLKDVD